MVRLLRPVRRAALSSQKGALCGFPLLPLFPQFEVCPTRRPANERAACRMTDRLLTAREVADRVGFCPATIIRRHNRGELPGFRLATNVLRFRESDVEAWLERHRENPGGDRPRGMP